ncbi:hypothetical protein NQZ68_020926 [Dissostichus eleginoides]|nr:hypothetical protein NQZ68_020926 [Dissostichus eleginoides]
MMRKQAEEDYERDKERKTDQQNLEKDKFQLKKSSTVDQQYMQQEGEHLPAAQTGRHRVLLNGEVPDYNYFCRETDEPLPRRGTDLTRLMTREDAGELLPTKANSGWQRTPSPEEKIKQYLEKDKFQLKESSTADLRPTRLPTKTRGAPAGRRSPPTGVESSKNRGKKTGERLPRLDTPKTPGAPAGRRSPPTGVESSKNRGKKTGERLPRLDTPKTRVTKQENSKEVLQVYMTMTSERLPRFATEQTKRIKKQQGHLELGWMN